MQTARKRSARTPPHSGRFLLRLPPALHARLRTSAAAAGVSLNEYCVRRLAAEPGWADTDASALVRHATDVVGDALVGVILYGSWARGRATPTSDVDALIVVDRRVPLTRSLYRTWDERPVTWQDRRVDAHFVHPPEADVTGNVWPEAALDGIVLFERRLELSTALAVVRRDIASGRLVRRIVHGQPYWTAAA